MKAIVLCADDYGQAPSIAEGILDLLEHQRLSAVSCMVNTTHWRSYAQKLKSYIGQADLGLHFNLTHGEPLSSEFQQKYGVFRTLPMLIRRAYTFRISRKAIAAELNAQIDAFEARMGFLPNFLDGHQHIHHLPIIRKIVADTFVDRLKSAGSYMRLVDMHLSPADLFNKKIVIYMTGVRRFKQLLEVHSIPYNRSFSGIYGFNEAEPFRSYFRRFLQEIEPGGLIMCHPGRAATDPDDEISAARFNEYKYLNSDEFKQDCIDQKVILSRFS